MEITEKNANKLTIGQTCWIQHGTHEPKQVYVAGVKKEKHKIIVDARHGERGFYDYEVTLPQESVWDFRLFTKKEDADEAFQRFMIGDVNNENY